MPVACGGASSKEVQMSDPADRPTLWVRVIADEAFREALIEDPLRALATFPDVAVSPDQIRQLDDLELEERRVLVAEVFREAHLRGGQARFGTIGMDGRLGGPDPPA
jgi:hypothetical protein